MVYKIGLFIKHKIPFLWNQVEVVNGLVFYLLYGRRLNEVIKNYVNCKHGDYYIKQIDLVDVESLLIFFAAQKKEDFKFFRPHAFDEDTLKRMIKNPSFYMMSVWLEDVIVGYFFLRFLGNNRCFVGRIVHRDYRRRGISKIMSFVMYNIVWSMKFRCMTTISKENDAILGFHSNESKFEIVASLPNDYLLVEIKK